MVSWRGGVCWPGVHQCWQYVQASQAHREAERFEIWSQDEARVGQTGRTGYIWCQRGHAPRGRRDLGHRSVWIIGAVCQARDTG
jgi:hypothetical protein